LAQVINFINGEFFDEELGLIIEESVFNNRFDNLSDFESLYTHKNATTQWKRVFDSWKERGILN